MCAVAPVTATSTKTSGKIPEVAPEEKFESDKETELMCRRRRNGAPRSCWFSNGCAPPSFTSLKVTGAEWGGTAVDMFVFDFDFVLLFCW